MARRASGGEHDRGALHVGRAIRTARAARRDRHLALVVPAAPEAAVFARTVSPYSTDPAALGYGIGLPRGPLTPLPEMPPFIPTERPEFLFLSAIQTLEELAARRDFAAAVVLLSDRDSVDLAGCPECRPPHELLRAAGTDLRVIRAGSLWSTLRRDSARNFQRGTTLPTAAGAAALAGGIADDLRSWRDVARVMHGDE